MNVAVNVVLWADPVLYGVEELHAAGPRARAAQVTEPQRRRMGHLGRYL